MIDTDLDFLADLGIDINNDDFKEHTRKRSYRTESCKFCNVDFETYYDQKYCGYRCSNRAKRKTNGYVKLRSRKNNTNGEREHRKIMEVYIGRKLFRHETVHHKNGLKYDNRIDNLELWSKSHPPGQRVEDKIKWCIEFLGQYGKEIR